MQKQINLTLIKWVKIYEFLILKLSFLKQPSMINNNPYNIP